MDRADVVGHDTGGVDLWRLGGGAGEFCRAIGGLGVASGKAVPWPAEAGILGASYSGDCHGLSPFLGGGARGA